jgi:TonB-dependent receptor
MVVYVILGLPSAFAQTARGTVIGTAVDSAGSALQGALVQLDPIGKKTASDNTGQFRITDVPPGDYTVAISYVGLAPFSGTVKVESGQIATVDATLQVASRTDEVVVTAERVQGEAQAINIQRAAENILQVLPAKVITSLPNTNIADAVGRLPSVTLERDEGEGKYVQIRGTEPRLSNVTINGVHVPSPEGYVRNIKLDAVPSDLVERIEVSKTLTPNQDGDAIGGTVNLVTRTPTNKIFYDFGSQGGYTPIQGGRSLYGVNGTIGRRFGSEKQFGLLGGGTWDHNNRGIDDLEPTQAIGNFGGQNFAFINSEDLRTYQYDRGRYGANGEADYNVRPGWNIYLRGLWADFHDYGDTHVYTPNAGAITGHDAPLTTFDNTGNMQYRHYIRRPDQGVYGISLGSTHAISSTVISYEFSVSRGHNYGGQDFPTTYFNGAQNVQFNLNQSNPYRPKLYTVDGTNIYDPTAYSIASTVIPNYRSAEQDYQGRAYLSHPFNLGSHYHNFEMGLQIRSAYKYQNEDDHFYNGPTTYPMTKVLSSETNPGYYDGTFNGYGPLTDYSKIQSAIPGLISSGGLVPDPSRDRIVSDAATWNLNERIYAGYLMDSVSLGRVRLVGGLRIEATTDNFQANHVTLNNGAWASTSPVTGATDYINLLPMIQAQILVEKNTNLRLSYGRGISRPNFQDTVPAVQADPNTSPKSLQVGNPALKPTTANNYDILIEHYFEPLGIVQAGFFYKSLTDPIYPTVSFVPQSDPNFPGYLRQQSINGPSARIAGFEAAWQQRLSFLPGLLSGFGASANYGYTASRVTFPTGFSSAVPGGEGRIDHPTLERTAPNTWNLGLTYDKQRFSMRFGVSHNDANIYAYGYVHDPTVPNIDNDPILGIKGPLADQYLYGHTQFDVQGSYRLYRGLQFIVSGLNLSNEVFGFYTGSTIYPNQREYYHPTVIVGMRWLSSVEQ